MTVARGARHRDVLEAAFLALVECLPSIAAAEVWQADKNGTIRCTQSLVAGGAFCRCNVCVDDLLNEDDTKELLLGMEVEPTPEATRSENVINHTGQAAGSDSGYFRQGLVIRPKRTSRILAAPFHDYCYKVGRSWIGADRIAHGFALVIRISDQSRQETTAPNVNTAAGNPAQFRSPQQAQSRTLDPSTGLFGNAIAFHAEDGMFAARVAKEVGVALACVRDRERRAAIRALALTRLTAVCSKIKPSGHEAKEAALAEISAVLPGCRAYIGVLQPGGDTILYESATANSCMRGRELHRGEGVSFTCLDNPDGSVRVVRYPNHCSPKNQGSPKPPNLATTAQAEELRQTKLVTGDSVEVWYATSWLPATILQDRGHQCYDVRYEEFHETEAGVPRWRVQKLEVQEHLEVKIFSGSNPKTGKQQEEEQGSVGDGKSADEDRKHQSWPWPFVCVPLRSAGNRIGVLGIDGWHDVRLSRPEETNPEKAVLVFLKDVGVLLATALYTELRSRGLSTLEQTVRGKDTTENSALEALIVLLRETITFRRRVDVLETRVAEPGAVCCRGTWDSSMRHGQLGSQEEKHRQLESVRVFELGVPPRMEELCITPEQLKGLGTRRKVHLSSKKKYQSLVKETTPYQKEFHSIIRDGPGSASEFKAKALTTRHGEIVGRFQRLMIRPGGSRPSADGWYLIRVSRMLPPPSRKDEGTGPRTKMNSSSDDKSVILLTRNREEGDISLLSEMCRKLEIGFMAIASGEQRALTRLRALDRVLTTCNSFSSTHPSGILSVSAEATAKSLPCGLNNAAEVIPITGGKSLKKIVASTGSGCASDVSKAGPMSTPAALRGAATAVHAIMTDEELVFLVPIPPPMKVETKDGRSGALVTLKDGRLAVLTHQGGKRVAIVEGPRGKQQILSESEVSRLEVRAQIIDAEIILF